MSNLLIRRIDARDYLDDFLVAAITSLLGIRFFLFLTNYPQLGGLSLHIAHMLWGGLLMVIAIIILLSFLTKTALQAAAIIGGLGFGVFIDELGKYITRDNNYFYTPAVAIIYIIFVLLYLLFRFVEHYRAYSQKEYLINTLEITKEVILQDLEVAEMEQAKTYLRKLSQRDPDVKILEEFLRSAVLVKHKKISVFTKVQIFFQKTYKNLVNNKWFSRSILVLLILKSLFSVGYAIITQSDIRLIIVGILIGVVLLELFLIRYLKLFKNRRYDRFYIRSGIYIFLAVILLWLLNETTQSISTSLRFTQWVELIFSVIAAGLVLTGVIRFHQSRLEAYQLFKRSLLLTVLLTQVFIFYRDQFSAVFGLFLNIIILAGINYAFSQEVLIHKDNLNSRS